MKRDVKTRKNCYKLELENIKYKAKKYKTRH